MNNVGQVDAIVLAVAHQAFKTLKAEELTGFFGKGKGQGVVVDVKGLLDRSVVERAGLTYWSL